MGRANYGRVGNRRPSTAIWQWTIIGITLGFACSAVIVLALLTVGVLSLEGDGLGVAAAATSTAAPTVNVQATVDVILQQTLAALPTATTPPTEPPAQQAVVAPPTATATTDPALLPSATTQPTATTAGASNPPAQATTSGQSEATQETSGQATTNNTTAAGAQLPPGLITTNLREVQGGTFQMGTSPQEIAIAVRECQERDGGACNEADAQDSLPVHNATINSFLIEEYEVTNTQYVAFLNSLGAGRHANGCSGQKCINTKRENAGSYIAFDSANYSVQDIFANFPASGVTWYGAQAYCQAIGRRLPTEAEWERAARGINNFLYPWSSQWIPDIAKYRLPGADITTIGSSAVGSFQNSSEFGIFDMAGNVAEWVQDFYGNNYYTQPAATEPNPQGPPSGTDRVLRGGSWDTLPFFLRAVHRQNATPDSVLLSQGFRCAADAGTVPAAGTSPVQPIGEVTDEAPLGAAPTLPPRATLSPLPLTPTESAGALPPTAPGG